MTNESIRPFRVDIPEAALADLRRRLAETRLPEQETVSRLFARRAAQDDPAGLALLADQLRLAQGGGATQRLPNFITEIDGLDIHFIHVRSKHEDALPLIVTHGWPGSVVEQLKIIEPLTNPTAHGGKRIGRLPPGDPVDARLRVLRQADHDRLGPRADRARLDHADAAPGLWEVRCARWRLGRGRSPTCWACRRRPNCSASTPTCPARFRQRSTRPRSAGAPAPAGLSAEEKLIRAARLLLPARLLRLLDGLAAANARRVRGLADRPGDVPARPRRAQPGTHRAARSTAQTEGLTRDDVLDNVTLFWLTNTGVSSARLYWENKLALLQSQGRHGPGRRERLPRRALPDAAELGGAGLSEAHPLQQARQGRPLRRLGTA